MKQMLRKKRAGFTLVELLVSMALLIMITLAVSTVFSNATRAMSQGSSSSEINLAARTALDFIASEISGAFLSTNCLFTVELDETGDFSKVSFFSTSSLISNQSLDSDEYSRAIYPMQYLVDTNEVVRVYISPVTDDDEEGVANVTAYFGEDWSDEDVRDNIGGCEDALLENVTEFTVLVNGIESFTSFVPDTFSSTNLLASFNVTNDIPRYVDITIGVLSDEAAKKAEYLSGDQLIEFTEKNELLFSTRVHLMGAEIVETQIEELIGD
jgi:type II secretory pathway pseudopilin PulG